MNTGASKRVERAPRPENAQHLRLLRQSLLAMRQRMNQELDAFDQRLAALEPDEGVPSTSLPSTPDEWFEFLKQG